MNSELKTYVNANGHEDYFSLLPLLNFVAFSISDKTGYQFADGTFKELKEYGAIAPDRNLHAIEEIIWRSIHQEMITLLNNVQSNNHFKLSTTGLHNFLLDAPRVAKWVLIAPVEQEIYILSEVFKDLQFVGMINEFELVIRPEVDHAILIPDHELRLVVGGNFKYKHIPKRGPIDARHGLTVSYTLGIDRPNYVYTA